MPWGPEDGDLGLFVADTYDTACACLSALRLHFAKTLNLVDASATTSCGSTGSPCSSGARTTAAGWRATTPSPCRGRSTTPSSTATPTTLPLPWARWKPSPTTSSWTGARSAEAPSASTGGTSRRRSSAPSGSRRSEAQEQFGFLLDAFRYGTPPHGGIAFGFDRLVMLLLGCESIRDVIPFPKTTSGLCLMTGSPGAVEEKQLEELAISLRKKDTE